MDELVKNHKKIRTSSDRSFGFVFTAFFMILALIPLLKHHEIRLWALILASCIFCISVIRAELLAPLNRLWIKFGFLLHKITSPIILGIVFFLLFTPIALFLRLSKKAKLLEWKNEELRTYWIARNPPGPDGQSIENQF